MARADASDVNGGSSGTLIRGGTVITMDANRRVLPSASVLVRDGAIVSVFDDGRPYVDEGLRVIDATDSIVIPGLVNAHTHLSQVLYRGVYEELPFSDWLRNIYHVGLGLTEEHNRLAALLGCGESLLSGVTTVVEHNFLSPTESLARSTIDGMRDSGMRAVFARTAMDLGELAPAVVLERPEAAMEAVGALHDALDGNDTMLTIMTGPNTPGISASEEMVLACHRFARERGMRQSMHLAENAGVVETVRSRYGVDGVIRWLDGLGVLDDSVVAAHSVALYPDEVAIIARCGAHVSHNPVSNMFLGDGVAPVVELNAQGANVCLGTDGPASNNSQDMVQVLKLASLLQRVHRQQAHAVPPMDALAMATINGARALGLDHLTGSIEPGKRADLALIDVRTPHATAMHDPVSQAVYCVKSSDVRTVLVDGRIVVADGKLTTMDTAAVMREAQVAGEDLVERLRSLQS